jgi:hypothetical protein
VVRPLHGLEESRLPVSVKKDGWNGFWFWSVNVGGRLLYGDRHIYESKTVRTFWSVRIGVDLCMELGELGRRICENKIVKIVLVGTKRGRPLYVAGRAGSAYL